MMGTWAEVVKDLLLFRTCLFQSVRVFTGRTLSRLEFSSQMLGVTMFLWMFPQVKNFLKSDLGKFTCCGFETVNSYRNPDWDPAGRVILDPYSDPCL
jgi:hypothetical protein